MTVVAYLAHPLGDVDANWGIDRGDNVANSIDWVKFLRYVTTWAICYPSFLHVAAVDDVFHHAKSFTDQLEILSRCDLVVAVGGLMSPHMRYEVEHARSRQALPVIDLLHLGRRPPWQDQGRTISDIARRCAAAGIQC